jgi:cation transport ATPase
MKKANPPVKPQHWRDGSVNVDEKDIMTARELATHASDIAHLQNDMDKLVASVAAMQKTLSDIEKTLSEAKGGWKMLMLIGGAGGVLGAALTQLLHAIPGGK